MHADGRTYSLPTAAGVHLTEEQVDQWTTVVNDMLPRASTADLLKARVHACMLFNTLGQQCLSQVLCAYGNMRQCPEALHLGALLTSLCDALPTMPPAMLVTIPDALGNLGLSSVPAAFDQEAFGEAVNACADRLKDHELGMLLRGLLKVGSGVAC